MKIISVSSQQLQAPVVHLVLNGLDTVALVNLNDIAVAATDNMFVRYVIDVKKYLKVTKLEILNRFAT